MTCISLYICSHCNIYCKHLEQAYVVLSFLLFGYCVDSSLLLSCSNDGIYSQHVQILMLLSAISADVSYADRLEALVEPSGGISLFLPAAVDDGDAAEAVRLSFLEACATAEPGFIRGRKLLNNTISLIKNAYFVGDIASEAMLEIRTCGRLSVRRVTGPVQQKSAAGSQYSASLRSRFRPDTAVFLQLERSQGQDKGKDGFPTLTHASRESVMEESDINGASINRSRYAYIQIIVRFEVCGQESASADGPSQFAVYRPVDTDDVTGKGMCQKE